MSDMHMQRIQRGLSLIELMVALVIGLTVILVMTQFSLDFHKQKRSTVGTAESMDEGAIALYTLRREIMGSGYGIIDNDLTGCRIQAHEARFDNPLTARDFSFSILPLLITQGDPLGDFSAPDTLTVNYSNSPMISTAASLIQDFMGDEATPLKLNSRYGFNPGDVIVLADSPKRTNPSPLVAPRDCSMYQVTDLPPAPDDDTIKHELTEYDHDFNSSTPKLPSRFNKGGGLGITVGGVVQVGAKFDANKTKVFNLGKNPVSNAFTVNNGQLIFNDGLSGTSTVLLQNVVTFQAQYGLDLRAGTPLDMQVSPTDYGDNMVDADGNGVVGNAEDWLRLGAVRVALVVRSHHPEINPDGTCSATTAAPSWTWGSIPIASLGLDWKCYRYKTFETKVPLRNMMWRAK